MRPLTGEALDVADGLDVSCCSNLLHPRLVHNNVALLSCAAPLLRADCRSVGLCTCYVSDRQVSGCDVPACFNATQYDCADTVAQLGHQTLSPCVGDDCPGLCSRTITAGAAWDNKCRPQVGK